MPFDNSVTQGGAVNRGRLARAILAGLLLPFATGCETRPLRSELRDAGRAEKLWKARGFSDYTFEIRDARYPPELFEWVELAVRGGNVTSARALGADTTLPPSYLRVWTSIDTLLGRLSLMNEIEEGRTSRKLILRCEDVDLSFDQVLGFPEHVVCNSRSADARREQWIRNVRPLR